MRGEADPIVRMSDDLDAGFEDVFVVSGHAEPADVRERLEALGRIVPPRGFARIDIDDAPAAIGAVAVEGEWAGIFGMRTTPEHRRKGLAWNIFTALTAKARGAGATRGYLQVEAVNAGAIALYARAGFEEADRYSYWARP